MIKCNSSVHTIDVNKVSKNFYPFFHPIHMWNLKCTDKRHSYTSNCSYLIFHLIYIRIYYNCVNNNIIIAIYLLRVVCSLPTPYNTHTHTHTGTGTHSFFRFVHASFISTFKCVYMYDVRRCLFRFSLHENDIWLVQMWQQTGMSKHKNGSGKCSPVKWCGNVNMQWKILTNAIFWWIVEWVLISAHCAVVSKTVLGKWYRIWLTNNDGSTCVRQSH